MRKTILSVFLILCISLLPGFFCRAYASVDGPEKLQQGGGDQIIWIAETAGSTGLRKSSSYTRNQALEGLRKLFKKAFDDCESVVDISEYGISYDDLGRELVTEAYQTAVSGDNFYITGDMELGYSQKTQIIKFVNIGYGSDFQYLGKNEGSLTAPDRDIIKKARVKFNAAVNNALSVAKRGSTDLEKVLLLHDYLVTECSYDYENVDTDGYYPDIDYTAYGVLVKRKAVCNGYSFAFSWIAKKLGIETYIMASEQMNHAWNLVKIGGKWYHLDSSRDDEVFSKGKTFFGYGNSDSADEGYVSHKYFLRSDSEMKAYGYNSWTIQASTDSVPKASDSGSYASCLFRRYPEACFAKIGGKWYLGSLKARKIYKSDTISGSPTAVCSYDDMMYALPFGEMIYFNREGGIYRFDPAKKETKIIYQTDGSGAVISELGIKGEKLVYVILNKNGKSSRYEKLVKEVKVYDIPTVPSMKNPGVSSEGLQLAWSKSSSADGYVLYYSESSGGELTTLATLQGGEKTSYRHQPGDLKQRYYKVRAYKKYSGTTIYSNYSSEIPLRMKNGWMILKGGSRKYFKNGAALKGWQLISKKGYYFDEKTCIAAVGWKKISGKKYYFSKTGVLKKSPAKVVTGGYFFNKSGKPLKGWKKIDKKDYYFNKKSYKQETGLTKIGNATYYLNKKGGFVTGKKKIKGKTYYFKKNGKLYKIK